MLIFFVRSRKARARRKGFQYQLREITKFTRYARWQLRDAWIEGVWEAYWSTCHKRIQSGYSPGWVPTYKGFDIIVDTSLPLDDGGVYIGRVSR